MTKKQKPVKVSLSTFLSDNNTGSWADEDADLPTVSTSNKFDTPSYGAAQPLPSASTDDRPWRDSGSGGRHQGGPPQREVRPMPDKGPYVAFLGNLPWSVTSEGLHELFAPHETTSIRIPRDNLTDKIKGFAYVEFITREGLKYAIDSGLSGSLVLDNRKLRVDVADAPKERDARPINPEDDRDFGNTWRRAAPVVVQPPRNSARSQDSRPPTFKSRHQEDEPKTMGNWRRAEGQPAPAIVPRQPSSQTTVRPASQPEKFQPTPKSNKPKSNPFGAAKPVDNKAILEKVEAKIQNQHKKILEEPVAVKDVKENQPARKNFGTKNDDEVKQMEDKVKAMRLGKK